MSIELLFFCIFAGGWLGSRIVEKLRLPGVLGMTLCGLGISFAFAQLGGADSGLTWPPGFWDLVPFIKSLALVIILLRAGLGISLAELKQAGISAVFMAFVPCILEGFTVMGLCMLVFGFSWDVAGLTGFMLAAVSPAVVVPSMLALKAEGRGIKRGVITTVLAGASADDVFAITFFSIFFGFATSGSSVSIGISLLLLPLSLAGGLVFGALLGILLAWWFKRVHTKVRASEKAIILLAMSVLLLQLGAWTNTAALLGVMCLGFVLLARAEVQAHELASKFGKMWIFAQLALFVIIGMSTDVSLALSAGPKALLVLAGGLVMRSFGVILATLPSAMNFKERLFCVLAYLPKATVQAALGGLALAAGLPEGATILAIAVLAILVTAPLGLIAIRFGAPRLLEN